MKPESGLQVQGVSYRAAPRDSGFVSGGMPGMVVSVANCPGSGVQASGAGGSARQSLSLVRELRGVVCGGRQYLYIGNSYGRRINFDTEAIAHSRPGDRAHKKAESKVALLEDRLDERKLDFQQAAADAARDNGKGMNEILAVNRDRLSQAQTLKTRLGDALSSQIRLDGLIELYKSFGDDRPNRSSPILGTLTQAVTRG